MNLTEEIKKLPKRLFSNVRVSSLNEPIVIADKGIALKVKKDALPIELFDGVVRRWNFDGFIEFEGTYRGGEVSELIYSEEIILCISGFSEEIPAIVTQSELLPSVFGLKVRGIFKKNAVRSTGATAEKLVFHLVNFPDYIGQSIHYEKDVKICAYRGRISLENDQWSGVIDFIPESKEWRKEQERNGGFYISHVGEIRPKNGQYLDESQLISIYSNLQYLLGFCAGTWVGPVFPQGVREDEIVWEQFASWKLGSGKKASTWMPTKKSISEFNLFAGFMDRINDSVSGQALKDAISWYIEANKPEMTNEQRIILIQIALETLYSAYCDDGESKKNNKERNKKIKNILNEAIKPNIKEEVRINHIQIALQMFNDKEKGSKEKIRNILDKFKVPNDIPEYLIEVSEILRNCKNASDILVKTRHALVHSSEENNIKKISKLKGTHLHDIAQMGIGFIELMILGICNYEGTFAKRVRDGGKGDNEISVPWSKNR